MIYPAYTATAPLWGFSALEDQQIGGLIMWVPAGVIYMIAGLLMFWRWMQRSGLEWFYRLCQEPRRLAKRYLTNNPRFAWKILGQLLGLKKYSID